MITSAGLVAGKSSHGGHGLLKENGVGRYARRTGHDCQRNFLASYSVTPHNFHNLGRDIEMGNL